MKAMYPLDRTKCEKRQMEPIIVEIKPNSCFEEINLIKARFGMVFKRKPAICILKERFRLKGDCFMFKPNKTHMMKIQETTAGVLWISTPPTF